MRQVPRLNTWVERISTIQVSEVCRLHRMIPCPMSFSIYGREINLKAMWDAVVTGTITRY